MLGFNNEAYVRWRAETIMVKLGKYYIPRVFVYGKWTIKYGS